MSASPVLTRLAALGRFFRTQTGWRAFGLAVLAGAVSALSFEPFEFFPGLIFGLAALVLLLDGAQTQAKPLRASALTGFGFGYGQFLIGLYWIGYAFLVDAADHAWQIPFVALLFPGFLALFFAGAAAAAARFWRPGLARILALALAYSLAEWLRGHVLTGFPWNLPAYGWGASPAVLQSAAVFGAYGLSFLTVLFGCSLAGLFEEKPRLKFAGAMCTVFAALFAAGTVRLALNPVAEVPGVTLRLVQPNIPQAEKYQRRYVLRNWQRLVSLSEGGGNPSIIIWPEAAPPFLIDEQPLALEQLARLTKNRLGLLTGAIRRDTSTPGQIRYANSFFLFTHEDGLLASYDKSHLVPFGEYLPFEKTLTQLGLSKLTGIDGSFMRGDGPKLFTLPGAGNVTALICYEILFPGAVEGPKRPDWFVNVTDDSWFGPWAGPRQHLLVAQVRAIEEGVPVIRDANTGISAIIDPLGRITHSLAQDKTGVVDGALPAAIAPTPYVRVHGLLWWLLAGASFTVLVVFFRRNGSHRP
jgi:apolipoprotein N-acyltransferase